MKKRCVACKNDEMQRLETELVSDTMTHVLNALKNFMMSDAKEIKKSLAELRIAIGRHDCGSVMVFPHHFENDNHQDEESDSDEETAPFAV